jgi:YegS/Rv2252/BmrU family lipid kinase
MVVSLNRNRFVMSRVYRHDVLVIFNPVAGGSRRRFLSRAVAAIRAAGAAVELAETTHAGHARAIAAEAASRGVRLVVAAGGDGTVAEVAAGLHGSGAVLGLLPLGTANVLAHELGVPLRPEKAAAVLLHGHQVMLHPGLARWPDGRERLFVQMLGAGFDAAVVRGINPAEKRRLGRGAYLLESLRQLRRYDFPTMAMGLDGGAFQPAANVIISKGRFYAGRYHCLPGADPLKPGFALLRFTRGGAFNAMLAGLSLPLHLMHRLPGASLLRAEQVALSAEGVVPAQADGDFAGLLPLRVENTPQPIAFLVPRD